jgi:hypothetical protein
MFKQKGRDAWENGSSGLLAGRKKGCSIDGYPEECQSIGSPELGHSSKKEGALKIVRPLIFRQKSPATHR